MKLFLTRNAGQCLPGCRVRIVFLIPVHFGPPDMQSLIVLLNRHSSTSFGRNARQQILCMGLQNSGASHRRVVVIAHRRWRMIERRHQVLPDIAHLRVLLIEAQKDVLDVMITQLFEPALDHLGGVILSCDLDIWPAAAQRLCHDLHDLVQTFMVVRCVQRIIFDLLLNLGESSPVLPCIYLIRIAHARIGLLCPLSLDHDWIRI